MVTDVCSGEHIVVLRVLGDMIGAAGNQIIFNLETLGKDGDTYQWFVKRNYILNIRIKLEIFSQRKL